MTQFCIKSTSERGQEDSENEYCDVRVEMVFIFHHAETEMSAGRSRENWGASVHFSGVSTTTTSALLCHLLPSLATSQNFQRLINLIFCSTFINTRKITVNYFSLLADNWAGASRRWAWSVYTGGVTKNPASHLSLLVDCKMWPLPVVVVITRTGSPSDATNKAMLPYLKSNGWKWF